MLRRPLKPSRPSLASLLLVSSAGLFASACGGDPPKDPYLAAGGALHDPQGRELFLHGVNARVEGVFDVTFDDGRTALEYIPPFTEADCQFVAEELGLDHLRLPISWSALEPTKGAYDEAYLGRVLDVVDACERHGVHTLVDLHQDAYSKEIGEDGAPLWAIVPPPTMLLQGPLTDLDARRTSQQVFDAFASLYADIDGVRAAYAAMAAWLATKIENVPGVVGLELQNEPFAIGANGAVEDFNNTVGEAVRKAAPTLTIFFEPNSTRNFSDSLPVVTPVPYDDAVYAPHIYTQVFQNGWASEDPTLIEASVTAAQSEADAHHAVLYTGEFGDGSDTHGLLYATDAMRIFDEHRMGFAYWVYEEYSQGGWGIYDVVPGSDPPVRGALRAPSADALARSYPVAIAGHVESFAFDPTAKTLTVSVTGARGDVDHVLAVPHRAYPNGATITCDGTTVQATIAAGRATFRCAGSTIALSPSS